MRTWDEIEAGGVAWTTEAEFAAALAVIRAAQDFVATTSSFRQPHASRPEFERLAATLSGHA